MNKKNIEIFYDYYDQVADFLYHQYQLTYIEGMNEAFNLLLDDQVKGTYKPEDMDILQSLKSDLIDLEFEKEEIRKSVQLGMLKGYKHTYSTNALITPDSIGIFMAYLIQKLTRKDSVHTIFDPVVGSGNLIYTIANQLDGEYHIVGCDNDIIKCNLARNLGDLLEYKNEMFYQDTLTFYHQGFDVVVCDLPLHEEGLYFPYQVINHHLDSLKAGGFFFALIENDFFEQVGNDIFKQEVDTKAHIFGLIKLSETLFKSNPKSILILRKKGEHIHIPKEFLLVDLPRFTDIEGMESTIEKINSWITLREDDIL